MIIANRYNVHTIELNARVIEQVDIFKYLGY